MGPDSHKWGCRPFHKKFYQSNANRRPPLPHKSYHRHQREGSIYYSSQENQYNNPTNKYQDKSEEQPKYSKYRNNNAYNKYYARRTHQPKHEQNGNSKFGHKNKNHHHFDKNWQEKSSEQRSSQQLINPQTEKQKIQALSNQAEILMSQPFSNQQKRAFESSSSLSSEENQKSNQQVQNQKNQRSFYIGKDCKFEDPFRNLLQSYLSEIQQLNYEQLKPEQLQNKFKEIILGHIRFNGIFPISDSTIGKRLISNGLFHQMWGIVLKKMNEHSNFWVYYQKYVNSIQTNHSSFQSMFNQYDSEQEFAPYDDSNTKLKQQNRAKKQAQTPFFNVVQETKQNQIEKSVQHSRNQFSQKQFLMEISSKQNQTPYKNVGVEFTALGRIRLFGQIQSNQRRLNLEIVAFFLGITQVYKLQSIDLSELIECYVTETSQVILLQAYVHTFCDALHKPAINYRPKLLLIAYGPPNLSQMLRLKLTYKIEGLVVFDEIFNISKWLKSNGYPIDT